VCLRHLQFDADQNRATCGLRYVQAGHAAGRYDHGIGRKVDHQHDRSVVDLGGSFEHMAGDRHLGERPITDDGVRFACSVASSILATGSG
jgi:hypothetical protein